MQRDYLLKAPVTGRNTSNVHPFPQLNLIEQYLDRVIGNLYARIFEKIEQDEETGCWNWTSNKSPLGYGSISFFRGPRQAHRVVYELMCEAIPADRPYLDHLCRNPSCVNPDHLEPVTQGENTRRGRSLEALREYKLSITHCKNGHELVWLGKQRGCRVCINARKVEMRALAGRKPNWDGLKFGTAASATMRKSRTHCKNGHEWTPENTGKQRSGRACKACHRERARARKVSKINAL